MEQKAFDKRVHSLTEELPALPDFSRFHEAFLSHGTRTSAGNLRTAFFLAYDEQKCEYFPLHGNEIDKAMASGTTSYRRGSSSPTRPDFRYWSRARSFQPKFSTSCASSTSLKFTAIAPSSVSACSLKKQWSRSASQ